MQHINISCNYLHYLQIYDHLHIYILEYIQRWRVLLKKIFGAERVKVCVRLTIKELLLFTLMVAVEDARVNPDHNN